MSGREETSRVPYAVVAALIALTSTLVIHWLEDSIGFDRADEGFLWYGTWRTSLGEVPIRDFMSYDPGRYYWGAMWSHVFGSGIMALRLANRLFHGIGLFLGLVIIGRAVRTWWGVALATILLMLWFYPIHKAFENTLAIAAVYSALLILENPSRQRFFAAGAIIGIAAWFGRLHGFFGVVILLLSTGILWMQGLRDGLLRKMAIGACGIALGYLPMVLMMVFIPGFLDSFIATMPIYRRNEAIPIPWPWRVDFSHMSALGAIRGLSTGLLFLLVPIILLGILGYILWRRRAEVLATAPLLAASTAGLVYYNHSIMRAGIKHLAQGIQPFILAMIMIPFVTGPRGLRRAGAGLLMLTLVLSFGSIVTVHPLVEQWSGKGGVYTPVAVGDDTLMLPHSTAQEVIALTTIASEFVGASEAVFAAPHWPAAYVLLGKRSPVWDTFMMHKETEERQRMQIEDLERSDVRWIILGDIPLDKRDDLRIRHTHPLLWQYITQRYRLVRVAGLPDYYSLLQLQQETGR